MPVHGKNRINIRKVKKMDQLKMFADAVSLGVIFIAGYVLLAVA